MDVCIERTEENAKKMVEVLNEFGFASLKLTAEDFMKKDFVTQLGYEPMRIDILNDIAYVPFEEAWNNKREVLYGDIKIYFIRYNELLLLKANAGRPQDLADIAKLKQRNKKK